MSHMSQQWLKKTKTIRENGTQKKKKTKTGKH